MHNDKVFALYTLVLIAGVASLLTASVASGIATAPSPLGFLEHLLLGLLIRASYKSFGGLNWSDWSVSFVTDVEEDSVPPTGVVADAAI